MKHQQRSGGLYRNVIQGHANYGNMLLGWAWAKIKAAYDCVTNVVRETKAFGISLRQERYTYAFMHMSSMHV